MAAVLCQKKRLSRRCRQRAASLEAVEVNGIQNDGKPIGRDAYFPALCRAAFVDCDHLANLRMRQGRFDVKKGAVAGVDDRNARKTRHGDKARRQMLAMDDVGPLGQLLGAVDDTEAAPAQAECLFAERRCKEQRLMASTPQAVCQQFGNIL
nr:hypothetical protein [Aminobacter sp. SR38]